MVAFILLLSITGMLFMTQMLLPESLLVKFVIGIIAFPRPVRGFSRVLFKYRRGLRE